jgi:hypothetical protein
VVASSSRMSAVAPFALMAVGKYGARCCDPVRRCHRILSSYMAGLFRPRASLHAEILVLRHQLNVLQRKSPNRQCSPF